MPAGDSLLAEAIGNLRKGRLGWEPLRRFDGSFQVKSAFVWWRFAVAEAIRNLRKGLGKVPPCKAMDELTAGDKVLLHDEATVLTRFPDGEEKETWRGRPTKRVTTFKDLVQTE